ncbi:MAG: hypothetical protein NT137_03005 [Methanomassiliicoccales archaeon]|nr:hypothetical protein [Methanomassiliicoccales archaeon]
MPAGERRTKKAATLESIVEGRKMEAYVEHMTKEMHSCWICGMVGYKRKPMKNIGGRYFCLDCLKQLKETFDTLEQWEAELQMEREMRKKIDESMRT